MTPPTITTANGSPLPPTIPAATYQRDVLSAVSGFIEATEIARAALTAIGVALQKGMAHSRPMLEATFKKLAPRLKGCTLTSSAPLDKVRHALELCPCPQPCSIAGNGSRPCDRCEALALLTPPAP